MAGSAKNGAGSFLALTKNGAGSVKNGAGSFVSLAKMGQVAREMGQDRF